MEEKLGALDVLRRSYGDDLRLYVAMIEWKHVTGPSDGCESTPSRTMMIEGHFLLSGTCHPLSYSFYSK